MRKRGRPANLFIKHLAWCPRHAFIVYVEAGKTVSMLPRCSCQCSGFSTDIIIFKTLTQAIKKVQIIRHARWFKKFLFKNWQLSIVKY